MARSQHATYTAADRYERRMSRRTRPTERRVASRSAVKANAIEVSR